jgi:hypothetical protein
MVEFNPGSLSINTLLRENAARFSIFSKPVSDLRYSPPEGARFCN